MYKPVILPLAKLDIQEAAKWYNERQTGLGKRFLTHIRETVYYIRKNPKAVAIRYNSVRTVLLNSFPYMIHFSVDDAQKKVVILAILHTARNPKTWATR
jgi:plasmid stabilization system protein ParE